MIENIIHQLALPQLEKKGQYWNFRCILCGDSKTDPKKKRGWILTKGDKVTYHCFNCGESIPILTFLKAHYPAVYKDYIKILFKGKKTSHEDKLVQTKIEKDTSENQKSKLPLKKLSQLDDDHKAVEYFRERKLPERFLRYFYYTDHFCEFINTIIPEKFATAPLTDPRIVIPLYTQQRKIFGVQGRALSTNSRLRYITIKFDEDYPKIFGLERLNTNRDILVFEGAFDSIFMPNSIAFVGADLDYNYLLDLAAKDQYIFCFDNEPRNEQMLARIEKALKAGFKVSLLPYKYKAKGKDINKMVENGMKAKDIYNLLVTYAKQGKMGLMHFKLWKKHG
jgi:DNA primase